MAWFESFLLGRPGYEFLFELNPEAMEIEQAPIKITQRNLAGDLKKSVIKTFAPKIKISSSLLSITDRNKLASLQTVSDTFLAFHPRDDWQQVNELATVLTTTTVQIANNSATRLSAITTGLGLSSIISVQSPFSTVLDVPYGAGPFAGPFGVDGSTFDPGVITYTDATRVISFTNALPDTTTPCYVSYLYSGWLVDMESFPHQYSGGRMDYGTYDITLTGA